MLLFKNDQAGVQKKYFEIGLMFLEKRSYNIGIYICIRALKFISQSAKLF